MQNFETIQRHTIELQYYDFPSILNYDGKIFSETGPSCEWINTYSGLILGLRPANERRRYTVTPSLIGCAQT